MRRTDVLVLGAGIVGVATALQIQARGRGVVLVDRRGAGEETSFGNAGSDRARLDLSLSFPARCAGAGGLCGQWRQ